MSAVGACKYLPSSGIEAVQHDEIILKENNNRWVMFPIEHDSFWVLYKEVENNFWAAEDFIFSEDKNHVSELPPALTDCFRHLLSYHIVLDNTLVCRPADVTLDLLSEVQVAEARAFYGFQLTDENVHSETVCSMFQHLGGVLDKTAGADKIAWLLKEVTGLKCFFKRVVLVLVSKLVFRCGFMVLRDFLVRDKLAPTYTSALDAIRGDLNIHARFAHCVFNLLENKMVESEVLALVREAANLELKFCVRALPLALMQLSQDQVKAYVECVANVVLLVAGYSTPSKPELDVDWLAVPAVDLRIKRHVPKQATATKLDDIKFDEDF